MIKKTTAAIITLLLVQITTFGHIPLVPAEKHTRLSSKRAEEWPLEKVLQRLESTRKVSFAYQKKFIEDKYVIYKPLKNENIELYLTELLGPLGLAFKKIESVEEDIFVIFPQAENNEISFEAERENGAEPFAATRQKINGRVEGEGVGPLMGVNVVFRGSGTGTTTDENGMFSIDMPSKSEPLIFSFIGYETSVTQPQGTGELKVVLKETPQPLSEVVVTAMGIGREQRALGYSVATLDMKPITTTGNTNFASALYGRAPGVRIKTAPGGATSAVTVQIRGLSSLNYNTQPLYVINGVVMRDGNDRGAAGLNNSDYFTDQRIRGNGILDIPVSDIETVTILKGASATALYGSDAANGVVVLTTKNGEASKGVGVSFDYHYSVEEAAFLPRYQNIYGPGFNRSRNLALGATAEGWMPVSEGQGVYRPMFESQAQFGPEMKGQNVLWWDGSVRKYQARPNNYQDFFRKGKSSIYHVAFGDRTERMQYRVSYTRNDYQGIQRGGSLERNNVSFNSQVPLSKRLTANVSVLYSNSHVHNRPLKINRLTSSWSGFFSRAEDMSLLLDKYQTSDGHKWVPYDQPQRNPDEALKYVTPKGYEVMDLLWKQLRNSEDEFQDRWISSASLNFQLSDHLSLLTRAGSDFTSLFIDRREYNEYSSRFNGATSTGYYGNSNGRYSLFYTDALLDFSKSLSNAWDISVKGGIQSRQEDFSDKSVGTSGGLQTENWFSLENSFTPELSTSSSQLQTLKYAFLGIVNAGFKNALFIEGTGRQEYSSTLPPGHGSYFYPSVNSSFVFSEFISLPAMFNYGRLRASYGIVGNAPPAYESNFAYQSTNIYTPSGVVTSVSAVGDPYGNDNIRPERKHEVELGLEARAFNSKVSLELTYYSNRIKDQIVRLNLPTSTGAKRILTNAGELQSSGWEAGITARPVSGRLVWTIGTNAAFNNTIVRKLSNGIGQMVFRELEGSSIKVVAEEGQKVGNIYVYPRTVDAEGNYVINEDGLYIIDKTRYVKAGNIMPVVTGGFLNNLTFRNIEFDFLIDYSFGGDMISPPMKYGTAAGLYESTLKYRTEAQGGLPYYIDASGQRILLGSHNGTAPNGGEIFHDGVLLEGATEEGQVNNTVVDAATYYINSFDWGNNAWNEGAAIYRNNYVKLREASLGYTLPTEWVQRLYFQSIKVSLTGRNLFYLWRTVKNADPETTIGSHWLNQGIDEGSMAATRSYGFTINLGF